MNWRLDRRRPWRYTASNSARLLSRPPCRESAGVAGPLDPREFVAPLPAARRKDLSPAFGLHARPEPVGFVAAAHFRLKRTLRQRTISSKEFGAATLQAAPQDVNETPSVNAASGSVKPKAGRADRQDSTGHAGLQP